MRQIRRFQDLTIGDNYMFGAVMMENDNCRQLNITVQMYLCSEGTDTGSLAL